MLCVCLGVLVSRPPTVCSQTPSARPVVAVALAGGGAWGFAHVGVLELIEELGIPVDLVVGTSIGSIVGAFYAAGYSAEQMVLITTTTNWNEVLFDTADRLQLEYEDRRRRRSFRATVGFRDGEVLLPKGASSAQRVVEYLDDLLRVHALTDSFLDMPRGLAIVATDLITGEEVVYTEGDLKTAIRASMSVPGIFSPVFYRGRHLIDGGWVTNIPVITARELGADIVIAINLSMMERTPEDLQSIGPILDQSAQILRRESIRKNLAQADIVITPDLSGVTPADFQQADLLLERGRAAAREHRSGLEDLAGEIRSRRPGSDRLPQTRPEEDLPVVLTNAGYIIPPALQKTTEEFNPGAIVLLEDVVDRLARIHTSISEIQQAVYALYDSGLFEYVSYEIVDRTELVVYAVPREIPASTLALGVGLRAQLIENSIAMALAHVRYTYGPASGATRWIVDGWLSRAGSARFALEKPISPHLSFSPSVYAVGENMPFFDGRAVESFYVRRRFGGELGISATLGRSWDIGIAAFSEWLALQRLEGSRVFDEKGTARYGGRVVLWRDTLDRDLFPRGGSETRLSYRVHYDAEQEHFAHLANAATRRYWTPVRPLTLRTLARAGSDFLSGVSLYERFFLGGVENWYGYYYQELQTRHYAVAGLDARWVIGNLPLGIGDGIYLVGGAQYGGIHTAELDTLATDADLRFGVHAGLAFETAVGALHLGTAVNSEGRVLSYIELGPAYTVEGTGYDW